MEKTLKDISWLVSEREYRADPALSYSTLSKYERTGFDELAHLFDPIETPSTVMGGIVDCLITGTTEEFNSLYYVADFPPIGEKEQQIAKFLYQRWGYMFRNVTDIPSEQILGAANTIGFYANWRDETRVKVLKERCSIYYNLLYMAGDKKVVDSNTYNTAAAMVRALHESPATAGYFAENDPNSPVQRYYQLKFKHEFEGVNYRCMADLIIVDYEDKKVIPCDLKTSHNTEWNFQDSFTQWRYMIQASLYHSLIRATMDEDDYFKDFTLENYRFIVVNKKTLTPLVWEFPYTQYHGTLLDDKGNKYRDPFEIGKELYGYLYDKPRVPNGIDPCGINKITVLHPLEHG